MAGLRDIKRRISSVRNTQKITRAMKMVAAAKLRRAQDAIVAARPYAYRMRALVDSLAARAELDAHPLLRQAPVAGGRVELVVITGDRGMCGAFNSNIVHAAMDALHDDLAGNEVALTVVGRKGIDLLRRRDCTIRSTHTGIMDGPVLEGAHTILHDIVERFVTGRTDAIYCLYNEFKSAISQKVTLERLLPFAADGAAAESPVDFVYEPSMNEVFESLLKQHMQIQMHRILYESAASEHGARMTAMESATNNAGDMIDRLTLQYNRARQDAITKELIEVVSGAEAL